MLWACICSTVHGPPKPSISDKYCLYRKGVQLQYREYFADINRWQVYVETCQLLRQRSLGWTLALQAMCLAARKLLTKRLPTPSPQTQTVFQTPQKSFGLINHMELSFRQHSGIINRFESYANRSSSALIIWKILQRHRGCRHVNEIIVLLCVSEIIITLTHQKLAIAHYTPNNVGHACHVRTQSFQPRSYLRAESN